MSLLSGQCASRINQNAIVRHIVMHHHRRTKKQKAKPPEWASDLTRNASAQVDRGARSRFRAPQSARTGLQSVQIPLSHVKSPISRH
eukprot:2807960-Rhodomonas_salina.7